MHGPLNIIVYHDARSSECHIILQLAVHGYVAVTTQYYYW